MDEQSKETKPVNEASGDTANVANDTGQEVLDELGRLGTKLVEVVQSAWQSDERKRIEGELKSGLSAVVDSIEDGLDQVSKSEQTKELINKAEETATNIGDKMRESQFASDMASGLLQGLRALSDQIDKVADDFQSNTDKAQDVEVVDPNAAQEIPIEKK